MAETVTARFADRAEAERALDRLRAAGLSETRVSDRDGYAVTVDAPPDRRAEVERLLDPALAPRPVQPGFKDVRPGFVPEPADYPVDRGHDDPQGVEQTKGRFARQLDKLPDESS